MNKLFIIGAAAAAAAVYGLAAFGRIAAAAQLSRTSLTAQEARDVVDGFTFRDALGAGASALLRGYAVNESEIYEVN